MVNVTRHRRGAPSQTPDNRFVRQRVILWRDDGCNNYAASLARVYRLLSGLITLLLLVVTPATAQSEVNVLLPTLDLSPYPVGIWPPPFKGQTATGDVVSLANFEGRVVLVNFWASWCTECRPEMPMFEQLHQAFAKQGLTVLGVNYRETTARIERFAQKLGLTFPHVLDPAGEIAAAYGVIGLPSTFLVGRDGRPVALAVGPRAWNSAEARAIIQALLAESVAQKEGQ